MRIKRVASAGFVLLISISLIGDGKTGRTEGDTGTVEQEPPAPPVPVLFAFRSLEERIQIVEEEVVIVGEMVATCPPVYSQFANFIVSSPNTPFVTLLDDSCLCLATGSRFRSLIRIAPPRGSAGKYKVVICGNACGGNANACYSFDIKVKAAS